MMRKDGTNWDIFSPALGLINYINCKKNVYHIILDQTQPKELFYLFDPANQKFKLYDFVQVNIGYSLKKELS